MVSQHALQVSRPTPKGEVEGSGLGGVSRPTPRGEVQGSGLGDLQAHTSGGLSQHALMPIPPNRLMNLLELLELL